MEKGVFQNIILLQGKTETYTHTNELSLNGSLSTGKVMAKH